MKSVMQEILLKHSITIEFKTSQPTKSINIKNFHIYNLKKLHKNIDCKLAEEYLRWFNNYEKMRLIVSYKLRAFKEITIYTPTQKEIMVYIPVYKEIAVYTPHASKEIVVFKNEQETEDEEELLSLLLQEYFLKKCDFLTSQDLHDTRLIYTMVFPKDLNIEITAKTLFISATSLYIKANPISKTRMPIKLYYIVLIEANNIAESRQLTPSFIIDSKNLEKSETEFFNELRLGIIQFVEKYEGSLILQINLVIYFQHFVKL
jgi:hypothetical protein